MRFAPLLFLLAAPLHAELLATFQTSQGNVVVALQYDKAPQAVANFITLAQGTRARIDPTTGALTRTPLYVGEKFFRVVNAPPENPAFKIAQTGSGTGINNGGPGYTFRDEFDPSLTHVPYVLSMANSGVHTNGSQIFFTGNGSIPHLDNVHTIFGVITDPGSRSVIDVILAAGDNGTTIHSVTISRTDPDAVLFDEFEQNLPECRPAPGNLAVSPGTAADYVLNEPLKPGTIFQAFRSPDLSSWSKLVERYHGTGQAGFSATTLDEASLPKAFYQLSMITYPDALAPASLANRTLEISRTNNRTHTFLFDSSGTAGTATDSQDPSNPAPFVLWGYTKSPYKTTFGITVINTINAANSIDFRVRGILDAEKELHILGSHHLDQWNGFFWSSITSGGLILTKPVP